MDSETTDEGIEDTESDFTSNHYVKSSPKPVSNYQQTE